MPKFPPDPLVQFSLESSIEKHKLNHLRVRTRGDLLVIESGPKSNPVPHIRLRRATRQWYTLEIATHTGRWERVPIRARANELFQTVIQQFPWALTPIL